MCEVAYADLVIQAPRQIFIGKVVLHLAAVLLRVLQANTSTASNAFLAGPPERLVAEQSL